jgi:AbrB family looped-hinge helix DNA binding protein
MIEDSLTCVLAWRLVDVALVLEASLMRTTVSKRGQLSIPSQVRKQLGIGPDTTVEWIVEGNTARIIPIPADPVKAFRGSGKKGLVDRLLKERRQDYDREDAS